MKIIHNFLMSNITSLRIGGPAKEFVVVKTEDELMEAIKFAKENGLEFLVIGGGSNLLVSDEGVDKLVIKDEIAGIKMHTPGVSPKVSLSSHPGGETMLTVKSGTPLQDLVDFIISHGLSGMQRLTGIPGTVGGAVYGAAGAYGQEIIDNLVSVKVLDPTVIPTISTVIPAKAGIHINNKSHGSRIKYGMTKKECGFGYRDSSFKKNGLIISEVTFHLESGDPRELQKESEDILIKRLKKYPKGIKCPGSFFKNIVADTLPKEILDKIPQEKIVYGKIPAGILLESVGAKGDSLDSIEIAPYHANLFINKDHGHAQDFYNLAKKYYKLVYEKYGIKLEPEVQLINLPPFE